MWVALHKTLIAGVVLSVSLMATAGAQTADKSTVDQLQHQGRSLVQKRDFASAISIFRKVAELGPAPTTLLRVVSLYYDLSTTAPRHDAYCAEVRTVFSQLLAACGQCEKLVSRECRVCKYIPASANTESSPRQAWELRSALTKRAESLVASAALSKGKSRKRALRKSQGLLGKARDVERCLGRLAISSNPTGALLSVDGRTIGTSRSQVWLFALEHRIDATLEGYAPKTVTVTTLGQGQTMPLKIQLQENELKPALGPAKSEPENPNDVDSNDIVSPESPPANRAWAWTAAGLGAGAAIGAVATYSMVLTAVDDANNARASDLSRYDARSNDAESLHGTTLVLASVGVVATAAALWMFLRSDDETDVNAGAFIAPQGIGVFGQF